jgi:hypothetical protein
MAGRAAVAYVRARRLTAHLLDLPSHGAASAARPWLVTALAPVACILLGAAACLPPTTLGLGFDLGELAAAGSLISRWSRTELALKEGLRGGRPCPRRSRRPVSDGAAAPGGGNPNSKREQRGHTGGPICARVFRPRAARVLRLLPSSEDGGRGEL